MQEALDVAQRLVQRAERACRGPSELSASTCDTDATWLENCTICSLLFDSAFDQHLQVLHRAEQVGARVAEPAGGLRQLAQRVAERVAVAVERVGGLVDEPAPADPASALLRAELRAELR